MIWRRTGSGRKIWKDLLFFPIRIMFLLNVVSGCYTIHSLCFRKKLSFDMKSSHECEAAEKYVTVEGEKNVPCYFIDTDENGTYKLGHVMQPLVYYPAPVVYP